MLPLLSSVLKQISVAACALCQCFHTFRLFPRLAYSESLVNSGNFCKTVQRTASQPIAIRLQESVPVPAACAHFSLISPLKTALPATITLAPASFTRDTLSTVMPPSTCTSTSSPCCFKSLLVSRIFSVDAEIYFCPPNPAPLS